MNHAQARDVGEEPEGSGGEEGERVAERGAAVELGGQAVPLERVDQEPQGRERYWGKVKEAVEERHALVGGLAGPRVGGGRIEPRVGVVNPCWRCS